MTTQKITELEEQVALMQKEIKRLKQEEGDSLLSKQNIYDKYKDQIEAVRNEMFNTYGKIVYTENIHSITTYVSVGKFTENSNPSMLCTGTGMFTSLDELNEEGLSAALDVFTNPRRISILKVLVKAEMMTATEIAHCTELQSGQLYHHLSILESAKLITKTADNKYKANNRVQGLLCGLFAVLGGMEITRN